MALSQFAFAVAALARPSPRLLLGGAALHGAMTATWLASRTVGLGFVPGAEEPAAEGVADIVAQVFSLGVVAAVTARVALGAAGTAVVVPGLAAQRLATAAGAGVLLLLAPAIVTPHDHTAHEHAAGDDHGHLLAASPAEGASGHAHAPEGGDDHGHAVGGRSVGTRTRAPHDHDGAAELGASAGPAEPGDHPGHVHTGHGDEAGSARPLASAPGHGAHDGHGEHAAGCDENHPAVLELKARVKRALERSYPNVLALLARGYFPYYDAVIPYPTPQTRVQHWLHPWYFNDGDNLDPDAPEGILLDEWFRPIGVMFISDIGVAGPPVYVEDGVACRPWHPHDDDAARSFYAFYRVFWQGRTDVPDQTPEMMHVWLNNPYGTFSAHEYPPPEAREGFPPPTPWRCTPGMRSSPVGGICSEGRSARA
jgi:hypothetical protein